MSTNELIEMIVKEEERKRDAAYFLKYTNQSVKEIAFCMNVTEDFMNMVKKEVMKINFYQIDCFTEAIFGGNPACVVPLREWLPDDVLLNIARENAVAETAFFIDCGEWIDLRWFTPEIEMDLCGHATLASAHVLRTLLQNKRDRLIFYTLSGELIVTEENGVYFLDFPARKPVPAELPAVIRDSLSIQPAMTLKARDYVLVYEKEQDIVDLQINRQIFDQINLDPGGLVVTSVGTQCDFVSRYFTPQASILEDPVTGSSHCSLIPYWSESLNKIEMNAAQLSARGGSLICVNKGERVLIGGKARTFSQGAFWLD